MRPLPRLHKESKKRYETPGDADMEMHSDESWIFIELVAICIQVTKLRRIL